MKPAAIAAALACCSISGALNAAAPTAWETTSYQDFLKAKLTGLAVTRDGRVMLAPKIDTLFAGEAAVWSMASASDGSTYLGTGHKGRLIRVDRSGQSTVVFTAGEAEIFAVAVDPAGRVYAATSPNGKIYRIENGKAAEFFDPKAKYVWSLAIGKDGAVYAGTGDDGKIFRITAAGQGETYYETGQSHVTALAFDREGRLLAGSEPNGLIYRVSAKDKAFVLHDAALPEIRSLVPAPDGSVYVAAMGGSVNKQATAAAAGATATQSNVTFNSTATTTVTVTDEGAAAQQGNVEKPKPGAGQPPQQAATAAPAAAAVVEYAGVEKSAIYRIHPDNTVDTLWSSKDENVYDLALSPTAGQLLLGTDQQGRIYELDAATRKTKLLAETRESEVLRLAGSFAATGTQGKLLRLGATPGAAGEIEASVHDATAIARWGKLSWQADAACAGCKIAFRTRTGNSARPDKTWSDWSAPLADAPGSTVPSPNARYVQWKAEFTGGANGASPALDWVRLAYLPQNAAPSLKSITVSAFTTSAGSAKPAAPASTTPTYSITITDTGEAGASSVTGTPSQPLLRSSIEQLTLSWLAEDTDNDKLTYAVYFRAEAQKDWKLLRANMSETLHLIDAEALADGRYWFRITVSDRLSNPAPTAREDDIVSAPILIDRTPPALTAATTGARDGVAWEARVDVKDNTSPLRACEYSVDGSPWTPLAPADAVIDSLTESFILRIDNLPPGEHVIALRAYDSANNAGVMRFVVPQ